MSLQTATYQPKRKWRDRKDSPLGLYIAVIREAPAADERAHRAAFNNLILSDGYEDFLEALIDEWQGLRYTTALQAAKPPTISDIKTKAEKRKKAREQLASATEQAKWLIGQRLLDLVMPNGKQLRHCTGAECVRFGGLYTRIGERVGAAGLVGKVLSEDELAKFVRAKS